VTQSTDLNSQATWTQFLIDHVEPGSAWPGVEHQWWKNPLNPHSLRLTPVGYRWIKRHTDIAFHAVAVSSDVNYRQLLQLERIFQAPYYLTTTKSLYVHSETDAVMLQLHGGDLATYLNNLQSNL
jgi:hypothetical protein